MIFSVILSLFNKAIKIMHKFFKVHTESKLESNPFRKKRRQGNLDEALLSSVQSIQKLGGVKARQLLDHFKSK